MQQLAQVGHELGHKRGGLVGLDLCRNPYAAEQEKQFLGNVF